MTKQELRKLIAGRVKNLSPVYCREADAAICRGVLQSELYRRARVLLCYVGSAREIDTSALLHAALRDGKVLALPLCVEKGVMEARQIAGLGDLVSGKYGILAPKLTCPVVEPEALELVVVPCAAGNERGEVFGGHLNSAVVSATCELVLQVIDGQVERVFDPEIGLNLFQFL